MLILLPLVILIVVLAYDYLKEFVLIIKKNKFKMYILKAYWIIVACFFTFFIHLGSIVPISLNPEIQINRFAVIPADINRINLASLIVVFIFSSLYFWAKEKRNHITLVIVILALFVPSLYLDYKYIYSAPSYQFRDTMIAMSDTVDGKILAGGWSFGMRLYNNSIPVLNVYKYVEDHKAMEEYYALCQKIFDEKDADYILGFNNDHVFPADVFEKSGFIPDKTINFITIYKIK